jgi:hypothetical protein
MSKKLYNKKVIGEAVYWALAGYSLRARTSIKRYAVGTYRTQQLIVALLGGLLTVVPTSMLKAAFCAYRAAR